MATNANYCDVFSQVRAMTVAKPLVGTAALIEVQVLPRALRRHHTEGSAATATTGDVGGFPPSDPEKGSEEKLKMPPSAPTIR
jgi:hypothetical protein